MICLVDNCLFTSAEYSQLGGLAYNIVILLSLGLWLKLYPVLRKISEQSIELIGALTTVTLLI